MGCSVGVAEGGVGKEEGEGDVVVDMDDVDVAGLTGVEILLEWEGVGRLEWFGVGLG